MSLSWKRPHRSYSTPSRNAPSAVRMNEMSSSENAAYMIANPPARRGNAIRPQAGHVEFLHVAHLEQMGAQFFQPVERDAALAVAVLIQDVGDGPCRPRRAESHLPVTLEIR